MPAWGTLYFEHLFGNLDFSEHIIYNFVSVDLKFYKTFFSVGSSSEMMPAWGKLNFEHLFGNLDFSEHVYILLVDLSFGKHVFLLGLLLKYCQLGENCFLTYIWES